MISSNKKTYSHHLIHLVLALSLLRTDPEDYFEWGWESLHGRGNVGLLELRAPTPSAYAYANRKTMMPLIEDLARFDPIPSDFQTYIFTHNSTYPQIDTPPPDQQNQTTTLEIESPTEEIFLNTEVFAEPTSIADQNLADLNDYGDEAARPLNIYESLKEGHGYTDLFLCERPGSSCDESEYGTQTAPSPDDDEGGIGGMIEWDEYFGLKHEIDESVLAVKEESDSLAEVEVQTTPEIEDPMIIKPEPDTADLTQEEMDLIKILATQDIDMGFVPPETDVEKLKREKEEKDTAEKLKVLLDISEEKTKDTNDEVIDDDFGGLPYTIDLETGEKILLESTVAFDDPVFEDASELAEKFESEQQLTELIDEEASNNLSTESLDANLEKLDLDPSLIDFDTFLLDPVDTSEKSLSDDSETALDFDDTELDMYIQASSFPNAHSRQQNYGHGVNGLRQSGYLPHHQSRVPLGRSISMEQRFDFPMFSFPPSMGMGMDMAPNPHYASPHFPYHQSPTQQFGTGAMLHQNSSLDLGLPPHQPHYAPNLGSAVASSMNLTSSESEGNAGQSYKMEHDLYYYSNPSSEMNHTDDFLNPMLNDEGLQHMDTFTTEDMCPMINGVGGASHGTGIVHGGNTLQTSLTNVGGNGAGATGDRVDASSDSAVSSMGSERVPSLSDGEWNDGSDSAQEYNNVYDYSYSNRDGSRVPVAQKKHQMFGKRIFSEGQQPAPVAPEHIPATIKYEYDHYGIGSTGLEGAVGGPLPGKQPAFMQHPDIKYNPYAIDFGRPLRTAHDLVAHNHSYPLPQTQGLTPRPQTRDKKSKKSEEEHLTRDEKRARQLSIPISVHDIINLPMDEFNERLSKYDLSETQLSLIRDIRRRGKNKVAAQNCRKRKLDQINSLAEEVTEMRMRKERLLREREMALKDRAKVKEKYMQLYHHVANNLRDADGNPTTLNEVSLQLSAEGDVVLVQRQNMENQQVPNGHQTNVRGTNVAASQSSNNSTHPHHPHAQQPPVPPPQQNGAYQPHHHGHHYPHQPHKE